MNNVEELEKGALHAAPLLLGQKLIHESPEGVTSGYIVETEAYTADDPANHGYKGQTLRDAALFGPAGTIYVYFTYGVHYCFNIVAGKEGCGEAVLVRALQPIDGIELMRRRRGKQDVLQLTNGPAKLVQALGITREHNFTFLTKGLLWLEKGFVPAQIVSSHRVGVTRAADVPWRFYIADSPYVSSLPRYT